MAPPPEQAPEDDSEENAALRQWVIKKTKLKPRRAASVLNQLVHWMVASGIESVEDLRDLEPDEVALLMESLRTRVKGLAELPATRLQKRIKELADDDDH